MNLPNNTARCDGGNCPSKKNCRRFTERRTGDEFAVHAALWLRRDAGASACDLVMFVQPVTTFREAV